jgi:hypothetical protein
MGSELLHWGTGESTVASPPSLLTYRQLLSWQGTNIITRPCGVHHVHSIQYTQPIHVNGLFFCFFNLDAYSISNLCIISSSSKSMVYFFYMYHFENQTQKSKIYPMSLAKALNCAIDKK